MQAWKHILLVLIKQQQTCYNDAHALLQASTNDNKKFFFGQKWQTNINTHFTFNQIFPAVLHFLKYLDTSRCTRIVMLYTHSLTCQSEWVLTWSYKLFLPRVIRMPLLQPLHQLLHVAAVTLLPYDLLSRQRLILVSPQRMWLRGAVPCIWRWW